MDLPRAQRGLRDPFGNDALFDRWAKYLDNEAAELATMTSGLTGEVWWSCWVAAVAPYAVLLRLLIDGRVTGEEFEVVFLPLYKNDATSWPPEIFDVLDGFFGDVDDFCANPDLRAEVGGIDEAELRRRAETAFGRLAKLAG
jgi:hypothetical protein